MIGGNRNVENTRSGFLIIWLIFCVGIGMWFVNRFLKGKRQLNENLEKIGDTLAKFEEKFGKIDEPGMLTNDGFCEKHDECKEKGGNELHQRVGVDVFKMVVDSMSYLLLAAVAWILIKLVYACFWLPKYLKNEMDEEEKRKQEAGSSEGSDTKGGEVVQDKKND